MNDFGDVFNVTSDLVKMLLLNVMFLIYFLVFIVNVSLCLNIGIEYFSYCHCHLSFPSHINV